MHGGRHLKGGEAMTVSVQVEVVHPRPTAVVVLTHVHPGKTGPQVGLHPFLLTP
ncbi:hypothetical protein STTU_3621 [Streptomyces sp. Tu6071]|nr:hypothetical protein STTU_3621 [Streptomyces sp. Tu6071]